MNNIKLIEWPSWWERHISKRHFLEGMPYIGPHARILQDTRQILNHRNQDKTENLWKNFEEQYSYIVERKRVFKIVDSYLHWPNHNFIPSDRSAIVFGFIPGIWIDPTDIIDDIALAFDLDKKNSLLNLYESASKDTLIDFFKCLKKLGA